MPDIAELPRRGSSEEIQANRVGARGASLLPDGTESLSLSAALGASSGEARKSTRPVPRIPVSFSESRTSKSSGKGTRRAARQTLEGFASADSSPGPSSQRKHTPATIPRTKFSSATPLEQRLAINKLRQKLDFEEKDEDTSLRADQLDSLPLNNEGRFGAAAGASAVLYDQASVSSMADSTAASQLESEMSDMVDVTKVLSRLNQVRASKRDQLDKLGKLIQQLRIQEQGYIDLLQRTLVVDGSSTADVTPSVSQLSLNEVSEDKGDQTESQLEQLEKLRHQHNLLKKIIDQQKQIEELKTKQTSLLALQEQAEKVMAEAEDQANQSLRTLNNRRTNALEGRRQQQAPSDERSSAANSASKDNRQVERAVIREHSRPPETPDNEEAALREADAAQRRLELENKIMNLQSKKEQMEQLLPTLRALRDSKAAELDMIGAMTAVKNESSSTQRQDESQAASGGQEQDDLLNQLKGAEEIREKLGMLKEVRDRLEELRGIVSEYESSQPIPTPSNTTTGRDNREVAQAQRQQQPINSEYRGARPREPRSSDVSQGQSSVRTGPKIEVGGVNSELDNRKRPTPPGARAQRTAIDVTRNPSSAPTQSRTSPGVDPALSLFRNLDKTLKSGHDNDELTSKIRQLQEARQRLTSLQTSSQQAALAAIDQKCGTETNTETEQESDTDTQSVEALAWQDDPEFEAKVRKLHLAKEKLKHLQDLVSAVQHNIGPSLPINDLADLTLTSHSDDDDSDVEEDKPDDEEDDNDDDDDDATSKATTDQQSESESSLPLEDADDDDKKIDTVALNNTASLLERERIYQEKLHKQRNELEQLLRERQQLIDAQEQLSQIARKTFTVSAQTQTPTPRDAPRADNDNSQDQAAGEGPSSYAKKSSSAEKSRNRVRYMDLGRPGILPRTSNLSVQAEIGSESDYSPGKSRSADSANDTVPAAPNPTNPLAVSELRRQRDLFEQKKKQKFVEKQRRKRRTREDQSDGGTYSIKSDDIDEGVGVSMISGDVTTAATWGGSTEQSSTEEDSAVGEEEFQELDGQEIEEDDDEYPGQAEEEEEEDDDEDVVGEEHGQCEDDIVPPLFDFKKREKGRVKSKIGPWFLRPESQKPGKKRKLDNRASGSVSWSMDVSPGSSRHRPRQQNLTPAYKMMQERDGSHQDYDRQLWERQCQQLHQQLTNSSGLCGALLRTQHTLLSMLQSQNQQMAGTSQFQGFQPFTQPLSNTFAQPFEHGAFQQRSNHLLQALHRCSLQLQQQQQDIQYLEREFQDLFTRAPSYSQPGNTASGFSWENPSAFDLSGNLNNSNGIGNLFRQSDINTEPNLGPTFSFVPSSTAYGTTFSSHSRQGQPFSAFAARTQRQAFTQQTVPQDTANQSTQTDRTKTNDNVTQHYSLFGDINTEIEPKDEENQGGQDFSPFRFYDLQSFTRSNIASKESKTTAENTVMTSQARTKANRKPETAAYNPLTYSDSGHPNVSENLNTVSSSDVITTSYPTPVRSTAGKTLAERQKAVWPAFLKDSEEVDNTSEVSSKYTSSLPGHGGSIELLHRRRNLIRTARIKTYIAKFDTQYIGDKAKKHPVFLKRQSVEAWQNEKHYLKENDTSENPIPRQEIFKAVDLVMTKVREQEIEERQKEDKLDRASDAASTFSLFEAMRDSIYSEVATLISMNESRPHYLIELFRELQLLTSDYLRQRALYALQDLVTRFLTEENVGESTSAQQNVYQQWGASASEQTPSESVVTTDDEDEEQKALDALATQIRHNDMYDYAELAVSQSDLSTPGSSTGQDPPFAAEGLGDTVINLDEALQKMRSYEEKMAEAQRSFTERQREPNDCTATAQRGMNASYGLERAARTLTLDAISNSSAGDVTSETSSDVQQPSIDTQKLDRHIKSIMMELIPFLNEHMDNTCTVDFLKQIKDHVVSLARDKEPNADKEEFGRFFHKQLESILQDSLSKFEGRKLKECGEDILIDVSEILFNELAFFRLMQDLDRPLYDKSTPFWKKAPAPIETSSGVARGAEGGQRDQEIHSGWGIDDDNTEPAGGVGFLVNKEGTFLSPPAPSSANRQSAIFHVASGEDDGSVQDEELAGSDAEDQVESTRQYVNLELSVSESRPVNSTGSGEEDLEEDQPTFPSQNMAPESSVGAQQNADLEGQDNYESQSEGQDDRNNMPEDEGMGAIEGAIAGAIADARIEQRYPMQELEDGQEDERQEDERDIDGVGVIESDHEEDLADEIDQGAVGRDVEAEGCENHVDEQDEDDETEVNVDDLPTKLTGLTEADLQTRMASEESANEGSAGVLAHLDDIQELAGNPHAVPNPNSFVNGVEHE